MNFRHVSLFLAATLAVAGCGTRSGTPNGAAVQPDTAASAAHADSLHKATAGKKVYTCSMHPEIALSEPGNCPKCGMVLVEKN